MTKLEELARDCIENHTHRLIDKPTKQDIYLREESIYIQGYRECERRDKKRIAELEAQIEEMKCCANCRFSESDKLNGTFCHREGCFVVASANCKLWEN
jgi:hypothetical protein